MAGERHDAAVGLHQRVIAGPVTKRPVRAEGGDRAVDEAWIDPARVLPAESERLEDARPQGLHEHVRAADEALDDPAPPGRLHVDPQAPLVAVDAHQGPALPAPGRGG